MARQRTTFGKLQRDREKQARARAKQERRQAGPAPVEEGEQAPPAPVADQSAVLQALADLHAAFEDGAVSLEDFETRRDDLTRKLRVD